MPGACASAPLCTHVLEFGSLHHYIMQMQAAFQHVDKDKTGSLTVWTQGQGVIFVVPLLRVTS